MYTPVTYYMKVCSPTITGCPCAMNLIKEGNLDNLRPPFYVCRPVLVAICRIF
jgi:hypothetical protein